MPSSASAPPAFAAWLLRRFLHPVDADAVLGDLEETFDYLARRYGPHRARRWYWSQTLRSIPPLFTRACFWGIVMFRNYLTVAFRALRKQRVYAAINVFGLAVGLAFCLLIVLFIRDELSYDLFHDDVDRLFRVERLYFARDGGEQGSETNDTFILGPTLADEFPEVARTTRFFRQGLYVRAAGDAPTEATEENVVFTDVDFFQVFTFPFVYGDPATALAEPGGVILTKSTARKHFDADNPIGQPFQTLLSGAYRDFVVAGVVADPPSNSTVRFDAAVRYERFLEQNAWLREAQDSWGLSFVHTYVRLRDAASHAAIEAKLSGFTERHRGEELADRRERYGWGPDEVPMTYTLRPIAEVHFSGESRPLYSYILSGLALVILAMACINFTTLSLGRSAWRAKEVGVRKVVGALRPQLMGQFWSEALLMSGIAALLGLGLAWLFLPLFNTLTGKALTLDAAGPLILALIGLALLTGLLAGSYPALVLSAFRPVEAFRGRFRLGGANGLTRTLIVVQFALSAFLLVGALVMGQQIRYLAEKDLGFNRARVVTLQTENVDGARVAARLRDRLHTDPRVEAITASGHGLGRRGSSGFGFDLNGVHHNVDVFSIESNYLDFFDLELVAGRSFDPNRSTDTTDAIVVNEALVRDLEIEDPLGKQIPGLEDDIKGTIVGIVRDFNFQALYQEVGPAMMTLEPHWGFRQLFVRLGPDVEGGLGALRTAWTEAVPDVPFAYRFLDEEMAETYALDRKWSRVAQYAALFAILIACLGLLGLTALTVTGRTKEIGIRKVLGASSGRIVVLIARDFGLLVGIGFVIAAPLAFLALQRFLERFAYSVGVGPGMFVLAAVLIGLLALGTVGALALRAARRDPVESLRYE